jgi:phosphatidylserine decarboxylase
MKTPLSIKYVDRRSGALLDEPIFASRFLNWSYNSPAGRLATDYLFRHRIISRFYGWLHDQPWSKRKIRPFAAAMGVNLGECRQPVEEFPSFNAFFTREIDLAHRSIHRDPLVCSAPADGKCLAFQTVDRQHSFEIKHSLFTLPRLLADKTLAQRYSGGSALVQRLHLSDYHHFHFPDSGTPQSARAISGGLYAVSPYSRRRPVPFYTENYRMLTLFASDHFGLVALVEIGAFTVGSIQQRYRANAPVAKGEKKGFFELGGSTIVLLFEPNAVRLDRDLCDKTAEGLETYVRLGDSIGRAYAKETL